MTYVEKPNLVYEKIHNANLKDFAQQESDFFQAQYLRALGEVGTEVGGPGGSLAPKMPNKMVYEKFLQDKMDP